MAGGQGTRRTRLGRTIKLLREGKRLSVDAAAAAAPMSATTWQRVEDGKTVRGLTYRGVEDVLGLRRGIIDDALAGKAALSELDGPPAERPASGDPTVEHLRRTPGLSQRAIHALEELAEEMRGNSQAS